MLFRKKNAHAPARPRLRGKARDGRRMDLQILGSAAFLLAAIIIHAATSFAYFAAGMTNTGNTIQMGRYYPIVKVNGETLDKDKMCYFVAGDGEEFQIEITGVGDEALAFKYGITLHFYFWDETSPTAEIDGMPIGKKLEDELKLSGVVVPGEPQPIRTIKFTGAPVRFWFCFRDCFTACDVIKHLFPSIEEGWKWPDEPEGLLAMFDSMIELEGEPETDLEAELTTEPATEPETEPVTEPATEPVTEPETEPATEPVTEPETEPVTEPVLDPM